MRLYRSDDYPMTSKPRLWHGAPMAAIRRGIHALGSLSLTECRPKLSSSYANCSIYTRQIRIGLKLILMIHHLLHHHRHNRLLRKGEAKVPLDLEKSSLQCYLDGDKVERRRMDHPDREIQQVIRVI